MYFSNVTLEPEYKLLGLIIIFISMIHKMNKKKNYLNESINNSDDLKKLLK